MLPIKPGTSVRLIRGFLRSLTTPADVELSAGPKELPVPNGTGLDSNLLLLLRACRERRGFDADTDSHG